MKEIVDTSKWTEDDWERAFLLAGLERDAAANQKSGFFDDPNYDRARNQPQRTCRHPAHNAPSGLVIPPGKLYRHVCIGCGKQVIMPANIAYL